MGVNVVSCVFIEDSHKRHTMKKHPITAINYLIAPIRSTQTYSTVTTHTQKSTIKDNNTQLMKRMKSDTVSSDFTLTTTTCKKRTSEATVKASFSKKTNSYKYATLVQAEKNRSVPLHMNIF